MPKIALTDLTVRSLTAEKRTDFWCSKTPSFGVRVGRLTKTFIVKKDNSRVAIGQYPAMSLQEARRLAHGLKSNRPQPRSIPFQQARQLFIDAHEPTLKKSSAYELKRTLNRHFNWSKTLDKISHHDVAAAIDAIDAKSEAAHALKDLRTMMAWCVPRFISHSPCEGLKAPSRYVPRSRVLSDDEFRRVWRAADLMGGYGKQVQLLIATGQRANQIISLQPEWIDADKLLLSFPAFVMKGNRDHVIPYPKLITPLLERFFEGHPTSYQGKKKLELDALSDTTGWVLHDLRRVLASQWASLQISLQTIERYLAHTSGSFSGIVAVYQRHDWMPEMREAVDKWENRLRELLA